MKYQNVLIANDGTFRVGDTKFRLTKVGTAEIKTVMMKGGQPSTIETAYAKQNGLHFRLDRPVGELRAIRFLGALHFAEIGAGASLRLVGDLRHHIFSALIHDLIDELRAVLVEHHLARQPLTVDLHAFATQGLGGFGWRYGLRRRQLCTHSLTRRFGSGAGDWCCSRHPCRSD